ncbi:peptide-binding protein [Arcobacter sp. FWKO B]|uniref:peptide-binding protein n=1 Tax=Arcobacter sp. FWKO B TaxID=2593672 RepID=UPI0018A39433|nr:peptide-binding protein [Arcobacter sp. FWKO B]QOG12311.1 peptide ABC transporter substrate-binding protein [Arcobacter sp. FWKO B]
MPKRFTSFWHFLYITIFCILPLGASQLNLVMSSNPSRINPILASDSASSEITGWLFNGLFKYDKDGNIVPDLAKSYKFEDNTTLIVQLKENVLWHDGQKLSSKDVLFTYETIISPNVFTPIAGSFANVKEVSIIDDLTIKITYHKPYYKALDIWMSGILPYHILKDEKELMTSTFNKNPIGTGPYKLSTFKVSSDIELIANENYFEKKPNIDKIYYKFIPDSNTTFLMLKQNNIDIGGLTPIQISKQIDNTFYDKYQVISKESFSYTYLGFNLKKDKFKNKKIREAIALAIDKQELVDILFFGYGKVCNGPFLPNTFAYNDEVKAYNTNRQKSKQILEELGFNDSNPFTFEVVTNSGNDIRVNAAEIIQHQLRSVGIEMKIRVLEWQAFLNTVVHPRNFDAVILGWSMSLMPDAKPIWHSSSDKIGGFNFVGYSNSEVDMLIDKSLETIDTQELSYMYKKIFKIIADDLPYIFLYIPDSITAVSKSIKNIEPSFTGIWHNQIDWEKVD